jgi:hypothetical protein
MSIQDRQYNLENEDVQDNTEISHKIYLFKKICFSVGIRTVFEVF